MFQPILFKFKKHQRGRLFGKVVKNSAFNLKFGTLGIKVIESGFLTTTHLEIIRRILVKKSNKSAKIWFRISARKIITAKAKDSRMGKGKGVFVCFISPIKAGTILLEIDGISLVQFKEAFILLKKKLPIKLKIVML